ncbi:MAG: hypothetical protein HDS97_06325 [Bacteroidales bacterium]|nr:hypothetical protein [Bacteroidales bacterium]
MDLENFITSLNKSYKESFIAMLCEFPLAYIDCWWVWDKFETLELFPQIIISAGLALILIGVSLGGFAVNLNFLRREYKDAMDTQAVYTLYPTVFSTGIVLCFDITSKWGFIAVVFGCVIGYWSLHRLCGSSQK